MKPMMNYTQPGRVNVPSLCGGINSGAVGEAVADNQLTDCLNVYSKGGQVLTRPKLKELGEEFEMNFNIYSAQMQEKQVGGVKTKIVCGRDKTADNILHVFYMDVAGNTDTCKIEFNSAQGTKVEFLLYSGKAQRKDSIGVFLLVRYKTESATEHKLYEFKFVQAGDKKEITYYEPYSMDQMYLPNVLINGKGNFYSRLPRSAEVEFPESSQLYGYNMLTGGHEASFLTDSISSTFTLPLSPDGRIEISVSASNMSSGSALEWSNDEGTIIDGAVDGTVSGESGFYNESYQKVSTLVFTIPEGADVSNESYYVDGTFPYYYSTGDKKVNRTYYRSKFKAQVNRVTGEITFPFIKTNKTVFVYSDGSSVTDTFTGEVLNNAKAVSSFTGKTSAGKSITLDFTNTYIVYINEYVDNLTNGVSGPDANFEKEQFDKTIFPKFTCWKNKSNMIFPRNSSDTNNMVVKVYNKVVEKEFDKIIRCTCALEYGGNVGLTQGTRTFVAGNKNQMYFSDIENPFYFSENCYIGVGESSESITALDKQGNALVIFKEHSIQYGFIQSLENDNLLENLKSQTVIDVAAQYAFNLYTLNSDIGTIYPNTICRCFNKLVFVSSDGQVHVINSLSQYSERNVFMLSGLIKDRLKEYKKTQWLKAFSLDFDGYYMLFVDDEAYVLEYNRNAFKYVGSFTDDSSVRKYGLFSWWRWSFPRYLRFGISTDTSIVLLLESGVYDVCTLDKDTPEDKCESYIVTKFFDFSAPDYYKGVEKVFLEVGNAHDSELNVTFMHEGSEIQVPIEVISESDTGDVGYLTQRVLHPRIRLCRKFGFKLSAKGPLALASVIMEYRLKGRVKNG